MANNDKPPRDKDHESKKQRVNKVEVDDVDEQNEVKVNLKTDYSICKYELN